jgi:hypothetical protein
VPHLVEQTDTNGPFRRRVMAFVNGSVAHTMPRSTLIHIISPERQNCSSEKRARRATANVTLLQRQGANSHKNAIAGSQPRLRPIELTLVGADPLIDRRALSKTACFPCIGAVMALQIVEFGHMIHPCAETVAELARCNALPGQHTPESPVA